MHTPFSPHGLRRGLVRLVARARTWLGQRPALVRAKAWLGQRRLLVEAIERGEALDERLASRLGASARTVVPRALAAVAIVLAVGAAVPLFGLTEELLAATGQSVLGVDDLPAIDEPDQRSVVLDASGEELGFLTGEQNREAIDLSSMPRHLRDAVIAVEDADFYEHEGIDRAAIARAALANVRAGEAAQGGSTLTQQYVKNALLTAEKSFRRKLTEAVWAIRLEERLDKDEILERYLNIAYFGSGAYGVEAASERYFGRPAAELDLARAALLAGLVQRPDSSSPLRDPAQAEARRDLVLDRMVAEGMIDEDRARDARVPVESLLEPTPPPQPPHPFFMEQVKAELLAAPELGQTREARAERLFTGGLRIHTTLDPALQQDAEKAVAAHLDDPAADPLGGVVSIEPATGAVRVLAVGPKAFGECRSEPCTATKVNPLVPGLGGSGRQPGSAFKPIVAAAALESGVDTDWHTDVTSGRRIDGCGGYAPNNYDRSGGHDDMVEALTESNNVFHVKLAVATGLDEVARTAARLGVDNALDPQCALALGAAEVFPVDLAQAYATFANEGVRCEPRTVTGVTDADGRPVLRRDPTCEPVLDADVAHRVTALLERVAERGTADGAAIGRPIAAKTGTTNDARDAWLVGYTPQLATAVWLGFEQPTPMRGILGRASVSGGSVPADIWADYMAAALEDVDPEPLPDVSLARYRMPACPAPPPKPKSKPKPKAGAKDGPDTRAQSDDGKNAAKRERKRRKAAKDGSSRDDAASPSPSPSPSPSADPADDPRYDGFDPRSATLRTGEDGDSFARGVQAERCVLPAPLEAYAPLLD